MRGRRDEERGRRREEEEGRGKRRKGGEGSVHLAELLMR